VVEGEKVVDALQSVLPNCVVTPSMGGAQSAGKTNWRPLKDRQVIIWPDPDEAGSEYAETSLRKFNPHFPDKLNISCEDSVILL
jgi:DNA primase